MLAYVLPVINRYFVYFDVGSTTTEAHALNLFTGALSPVMGSPFASTVAGFPDPTGRFMFSATFTAAPNNIRSYTIDTYTGVLQPTSVPLASANNQPVYADFTPDGRFVYFMNNTSLDVSAFSIDRTTGNLTKISDYPTSCACANLAQLRVTPNGKFLYVIGNGGAQPISGFSINQIDGTLTFIANLNTGVALSDGILVDAGSQYLYAINNTGVVFGYSINASSGVLTALAGSPFAGTANNFRGAMHPTGRFIYTVSVAGAQLGKQDVGSGGTLSVASTLGFGTNLQYVTVDPTGSFGFINNGGTNNYYVFSINSVDGAPTLLAGNPFTASGNPGSFSVARTQSNR
ncbi:MAG: beta-propeller fold lactonase family protein [Leptospiraceae bacterium]|nr:beta-propeller fold lactonase family protein [Leptospiraceae bacterium]